MFIPKLDLKHDYDRYGSPLNDFLDYETDYITERPDWYLANRRTVANI